MNNEVDRLLELEFEKWKTHAHLRKKLSDNEEQEYNSLKSKIIQNQKIRQLIEKQIEFQRQIEPPNYNSTSLLHIFQSLLDEAKR